MPLQITGLDEAIAEHELLAARAGDISPLLEQFRAEIEAMIDRAWGARVSPGGDRWPSLKRDSDSDGELRNAVSVAVDGNTLTIRVGARHASFQFFGTSRMPSRNPLPIEPVGDGMRWMTRGEAGAWLDGMAERLGAYLAGADGSAA